MKNKTLILLAAAVLGVACNTASRESTASQENKPVKMSYVRVLNTLGDDVEIFAGEEKAFSNLKSDAVVDYRPLSAGVTTLHLRRNGAEIAKNIEYLGAETYSTIVLHPGNKPNSGEITLVKDHTWAPNDGNVKLRIVHAIPGLSDLDVFSQGQKVLAGVDFKDESRYFESKPVESLEVRRKDNHELVTKVSNLTLEPNKAYTVVISGGDGTPKSFVLEDRVEDRPDLPPPFPITRNLEQPVAPAS